jgi:ribosome-binding protein aMBF1 (putative translation factor)
MKLKDLVDSPHWRKVVTQLIREAKAASGMRYKDISIELNERYGVVQTEANIKSKLTQGTFGAQLMLQMLSVLNYGGEINKDVDRIYKEVMENEKK